MANLIDRIDSANRDDGMAAAAQHVPEPLDSVRRPGSLPVRSAARADVLVIFLTLRRFSSGTTDKQGRCKRCSIWVVVRKPRSFISLANPKPAPSASPPNRPIAKISLVFGLVFFCGVVAGEMTRASVAGN